MTDGTKMIAGLAAALMLLSASPAMATRNKVFFRNTTDKTLKMDCREIKGRHDAFPSYTCYDDQGNSHPIKPDADWELVEVNKVCFLHQVRDTIRTCVKITGQGDASISYACFKNNKVLSFQPTPEWEEIDQADSRCAPHFKKKDVPRIIVIPALPTWREKVVPEK